VHEVVRTFVRDGAQLERIAQRLAQAQRDISTRIETQYASGAFNERELGKAIEETVKELVPLIAADIAAVAVAAALSGDESVVEDIERRAAQLEKTIEREVEQRAEALERRAESLCPRIAALDTLESELEVRLADGARLDLVRRD
jgi:DNA repair exonuclease SbcCD ATPase subunit